jgi:diacylglycerol diphosphate phosphatase/phosphatidate phosphatase
MHSSFGDDTVVTVERPYKSFFRTWRVAEWIVCLALIGGFIAFGKWGPVYCRPTTWDDVAIARPYKPNTFPTYSLVPISVAPVLIYVGLSFAFPIGGTSGMPPVMEASALALMQARSIALNCVITEPLKMYAGEFRPDFLARLQRAHVPRPEDPSQEMDYCNITTAEVVEGRKSFPSGHSSTSFAAMTPLVLFLVKRLGVAGHARGSIARLLVGMLPMVLAAVVAVSRTHDNRHHFVDICAGSFIGFGCGIAAYWLSMRPIGKHLTTTIADDTPRSPGDAPQQRSLIIH